MPYTESGKYLCGMVNNAIKPGRTRIFAPTALNTRNFVGKTCTSALNN
ncbi:MAG: hypothetical protein KAI83_02160 [Thiomargarita sp.]|nr:hypothetical protein [Thiomargarita sp.]